MNSLEKIYKKIPHIQCKKKCFKACGPITASRAEIARIEERTSINIHTSSIQRAQNGCFSCPFLKNNECSIYDIRPLICRLFGVVKKLECPHGCKPARFLKDRKSKELIKEADKIT